MMIYTESRNKYSSGPSIFDTKTGIVYDMEVGHPIQFTFEEAEEKGELFPRLRIHSVQETTEESYGVTYEGESAENLWTKLLEQVVNFEDVVEFTAC